MGNVSGIRKAVSSLSKLIHNTTGGRGRGAKKNLDLLPVPPSYTTVRTESTLCRTQGLENGKGRVENVPYNVFQLPDSGDKKYTKPI